MSGKVTTAILLMTAALVGGSACAMNHPNPGSRCQVVGASKLPDDTGGADALCAAVEQALQAAQPKPVAVEVTVVSPYSLSATVMLADGRKLSEIKVNSSDRQLGARAVRMLADSIAAQVAAQQAK